MVTKTLKHYMKRMAWIVVLLFGYQGIPEPRKAEQQDFSPAFCKYAGLCITFKSQNYGQESCIKRKSYQENGA